MSKSDLTPEQRAQKKADKKARKAALKVEEAVQAAEQQQQQGDNDAAMTGAAPAAAPAAETDKERRKREKREAKKAKRSRDEEEGDAAGADAAAEEGANAADGERKSKKAKKSKAFETPSTTSPSTSAAAEEEAAPVASTSSASVGASAASPAEVKAFLEENKISFEPESTATDYPPVLSFASLPLNAGVRKGLSGFSKPTPIQSASFPLMLGGRDVIGIAETGSGKTVAFGVPAIEHILSLGASSASAKKGKSTAPVSVLVVAPTRELAMQTHNNLSLISNALSPKVSSVCLYGGVPKPDQIRILRNERPRIVVGTPGRLLDLAREGNLDLGKVSWLVLDEADRMLDKGFENDIREIIKLCLPSPSAALGPIKDEQGEPKFRRTAMFSATWPMSVRKLAADFMTQPLRITVGSDSLQANARVEQVAIVVEDQRKKETLLLTHLRDNGFSLNAAKKQGAKGKDREKALVFALYKKEATRLHEFLRNKGYEVVCINGDMTQDKRTKSLDDFKDGRANILVATDVAARGLDIPKVELVINQTFPLTIEDYIHRIGRTGRAGRTGKSITFFGEPDKALAGQFIRVLKDSNAVVPPGIDQWGSSVKKETHGAYGAFFRNDIGGTAKKITFD
ncbi:ATP-dependent RNA helicase DBP3 [Rhodotorula diobovata]|uniref:RNA helicase n=1 Tax=Rhodotorula diobovata TaxID=5288 RepID=A0A5C5FY21_9BASI|nr:ATP-dependent RNA helicase DBP3 [Rhodotorula diobovata]